MARKRIAHNPQTGEVMILDKGEWRLVKNDEVGQLQPRRVLQEMGVDPEVRVVAKSFLNRNTALMYLRAQGLEVLPYGEGINFAVRKPGDTVWKLLDPEKGGVVEFFRDILDFTGDLAVAGATAVGTLAGGGLASAATGAAAGVIAETGRQAIGSAILRRQGIDPLQNIDPLAAAGAGIGGAIAPGVGSVFARSFGAGISGAKRLVRATGRLFQPEVKGGVSQVGRFGEDVVSRVTAAEPGQNLPIEEIFMTKAGRIRTPEVTPDVVDDIAAQYIDNVAPSKIGSLVAKRTVIEDSLQTAGRTMNIEEHGVQLSKHLNRFDLESSDPVKERFFAELQFLLKAPTKAEVRSKLTLAFGPVPQQTTNKAFDTADLLWRKRLRNSDIKLAIGVKERLQDYIKNSFAAPGTQVVGAARPVKGSTMFKEAQKLQAAYNKSVREQLVRFGSSGKQVNTFNDEISKMAGGRDALRNAIDDSKRGLGERFFVGLFGKAGKADDQRLVQEFDRLFNTDIFKLAKSAGIGLKFTPVVDRAGKFGIPSAFPKLATTGGPLLAGVIGAAGGAAVGVDPTSAGLLAFGLTSPQFLVRATPLAGRVTGTIGRGLARAGNFEFAIPAAANLASRTAALSVMQGVIRRELGKQVANKDGKKVKGRVTVFGGAN